MSRIETHPTAARPRRSPSRFDAPHADGGPAASPSRRRSAVPWGVVGMIGLILMIEAGVGRRWRDLSDPVSLSWQFADRAARRDAEGCDVLFLGDSLVKHGLIPSVVRGESGLRSVNLAAARAPALFTYFVLRRALDAGARPRAIVIETKPAVLIGGVEYDAGYWPSVLSPLECLELGRIAGKGPLAAGILTARLLPSLRSRLEVRASVSAALADQPDPVRAINRMLWRNWEVNDGANVAMLDPGYDGSLPPDINEKVHPDRWYVDRSNAEGLDRLLKLASDRGIRVFWLLPPIAPALQGLRERLGTEAKYEQFIRAYQRRYPAVVTVLDARRMARRPSLYVDATHLSGRGAVVLSRAVARTLREESGRRPQDRADGWITLPDPSPAADPPLEDVERSKEIVRGS